MNKKTLAALAATACVTGTPGAWAQSSVTVFGALDASVSHYSATSVFYNNTGLPAQPAYGTTSVKRSQTALANSATTPSRLGFRGTEDLGGGLAASFWLEAGLNNDTGGGAVAGSIAFNRRSTLSLSGRFGELRLGRDYSPTWWNDALFSPFSTLGVGTNLISSVASSLQTVKGPGSALAASDNYMRTSNSIGYFLPRDLGGFYGQFQYAFHENASQSNLSSSPSTKGRQIGGRLGYAAGPLDVALAYTESTAADALTLSTAGVPASALKEKIKTLNLGASYDFKVFKLMGELSQLRDVSQTTTWTALGPVSATESDKYRGALIGATVPVGAGLIKASYGRVKFDNDLGPLASPLSPARDASASKWALGYEHHLSKRTALYATVARVRVKNGQNNPAIMGASVGGGATYLSTGNGTSGHAPGRAMGYDIGMRHVF